MRSLSISRLKATLSEQLRRVQKGEEVLVTDRGRPVARIVPLDQANHVSETLRQLEKAGLARIGGGKLAESFWNMRRPADPGDSVRRAVMEEREAGH